MFGRILAVAVAALGILAIVTTAVAGDLGWVLRSLSPIALVVVLTFATFWLPAVSVRADEIEVRNIFTTSHVPWPAIRRIDTKWALALETDTGTVNAWASPAPGRHSVLGMSRGDVRGTASSARAAGASIRPGDSLSTATGAIAHVIRTHWEELRDDGLLDEPNSGTGARREVHRALLIVIAVLAVATVLSLVL